MSMDRLTGPLMMACIALLGGASALRTDWRSALSPEFEDGETQSRLEFAFSDALWWREPAISSWATIDYALFRQGAPGVVIGRDGWLFTDEEYRADPDFQARSAESIARIVETCAALRARGIRPLVLLMPDKARIMHEKLRLERPPQVEARYDEALSALRGAGLDIADLRAVLSRSDALTSPFLRTDTHWTPEGAAAVARHIAPQIAAATTPRTAFAATAGAPHQHSGDLARFVPTGIFDQLVGPGADPVAPQLITPEPAGLGLFDDPPPIPAALVGTSYSADPTWNFLGALQYASQTDFLSFATKGEGPFLPMDRFVQSVDAGEITPQLVVWEIPERYLTLSQKVSE